LFRRNNEEHVLDPLRGTEAPAALRLAWNAAIRAVLDR